MKRVFMLATVMVAYINAFCCTNVIVGKKASADGSVIVSYSADSYGMYGNVNWHVGGSHKKGEMRPVYDWDSNKYQGEILQAEHTYNVIGQMNQNQVSICETTFGGREELWEGDGIVDYGSLIYIALERAKTAQDALEIMTSLVEQYGYTSEGETFTIADPDEVWVLEMIGKGKGTKGAVWAAVRIPDDCVCAHANQSRITRFSQFDKKQLRYSKDCIKFAREKGYFDGKDADFSFRDAYNPLDFGGVRYCDARAWSAFNHMCDGMDKYVDYAMGKDLKGEMPLYMKPNRQISVRDVMNIMRDHYEGTPFEILNELGAGPYNMPYRPTPLSFEVDGVKYFNERPISTQQTGFCFVGQMNRENPSGIAWMTNDDPNMAPFVPLYSSLTEVPRVFRKIKGKQDDVHFSWKSAFWLQNTVSNMVYPYYSKMFPDLKSFRDEVEDANFNMVFKESSEAASKRMMKSWGKLFKYLVVRHNDMAMKKVDEKRHFKMTANGLAESPERPGYPTDFARKAMQSAKKDYKMPK